MSNVQLEAFGEPFNSEKAKERFRKKHFECPFDKRIELCNKPNKGELRYGNCSAKVGQNNRIICPKRFYEDNFKILRQVKNFIWDEKASLEAYDELSLRTETSEGDSFHYGNIDWILVNPADCNDFCGIEVQTDATTGTGKFSEGIKDLMNGTLKDSYNFGLNTLATFKGFLTQFIFKGQLFDDWKKPYIAIIQDELWDKFINKFRIRFKEIDQYTTETFIFFVNSLEYDNAANKYFSGTPRIYSTRWIDLLFSFSVESDLLFDLSRMLEKIENKVSRNSPIIRI